ncbi:MAG: hypothetical protein DMG69_24275 [Acidobacteria bacterium]|nr:MAG: hypothetical protein DMG69_24275 [Acidobacteriota bacterium]
MIFRAVRVNAGSSESHQSNVMGSSKARLNPFPKGKVGCRQLAGHRDDFRNYLVCFDSVEDRARDLWRSASVFRNATLST